MNISTFNITLSKDNLSFEKNENEIIINIIKKINEEDTFIALINDVSMFKDIYNSSFKNTNPGNNNIVGYIAINQDNKLYVQIEQLDGPSKELCLLKEPAYDSVESPLAFYNTTLKNQTIKGFKSPSVATDRNPITVNITFTDTISTQRGGSRKTTRKSRKGKKRSSRKMKTKGRK
jgi:hypothetical protein